MKLKRKKSHIVFSILGILMIGLVFWGFSPAQVTVPEKQKKIYRSSVTFPPPPSKGINPDIFSIAFVSDRDGTRQIYKMAFDGTMQQRLTNNRLNDHSPKWSPDKTSILFVRELEKGNSEIYLIDANGKNEKRLTKNNDIDTTPVWSPDGKKIAFIRKSKYSRNHLFVMDADGKNQRLITIENQLQHPCWSWDSKKIAFFYHQFQDIFQIYVMDIEKNQGRDLFAYHQAGSAFPSWTPGNSVIIYRRFHYGQHGIWKWKVKMGGATGGDVHWKLVSTGKYSGLSDLYKVSGSVFVGRNGLSKVAYGDLKDGKNIYLVNSDGSGGVNLTGDQFTDITSWEWNDPLGTHIILSARSKADRSTRNIYIIEAKKTRRGVKMKQLTHSKGNDVMPDF